jgi:hypothetical protein
MFQEPVGGECFMGGGVGGDWWMPRYKGPRINRYCISDETASLLLSLLPSLLDIIAFKRHFCFDYQNFVEHAIIPFLGPYSKSFTCIQKVSPLF